VGIALPLYEATLGSLLWHPEGALGGKDGRSAARCRENKAIREFENINKENKRCRVSESSPMNALVSALLRRGRCTDPYNCNWALQQGLNATGFGGGGLQDQCRSRPSNPVRPGIL